MLLGHNHIDGCVVCFCLFLSPCFDMFPEEMCPKILVLVSVLILKWSTKIYIVNNTRVSISYRFWF